MKSKAKYNRKKERLREAHGKANRQDRPLYPISIVAELLGITRQTLRVYEKEGLVTPARRNSHRYYSDNDIKWIQCMRDLIHNKKISIKGIKKLFDYAPCWELTECPNNIKEKCSAYIDRTTPCWKLNKLRCRNSSGKQCKECFIYLSESIKKKAKD
jgi:MerR family transcriptional regulator/heat shock protein HspR